MAVSYLDNIFPIRDQRNRNKPPNGTDNILLGARNIFRQKHESSAICAKIGRKIHNNEHPERMGK